MTRFSGLFAILSFGAVVLATVLFHAGTLSHQQLDVAFAVVCGCTVMAFLLRAGAGAVRAISVATVITAAAIALRIFNSGVSLTPYLAVILINSFVAFAFARGLMPGRVPLILQVTKLTGSGPEGSHAFRRFVYGQCMLWAGFGAVTALAGCVAMLSLANRPPAAAVITGLIVLQIVWFVVSHMYANRRYGRPETWLGTLRAFSRPSLWSRLEI